MMKQKTGFIAMLLILGTLLLACQPQVAEVVEEPAEAVETASEMVEEAMEEMAEEEAMDDSEMAEDEAHSDADMAEEESMDDGEMAMEDEEMSEEGEMAMEEGGEVVYTIATADSVVNWKGAKAVGSAHTGTIDISEGALTLADGSLVSGSFVIDMTTIASNDGANARLAQHLKDDDFFGVATFPTATLVINSAEDLGDGTYAVTGDLTIKEITNPIEFTAAASEADGLVTATADIVFDRALYDVQYGSESFFSDLGNDLINDEVEISVELVAQK